jgi:aminoglycoside 6'-N-acetyltransferase
VIEILRTPRLVVRRFSLDDLDAFHAYRDDPDVARWQSWETPYPKAQAESLVEQFATGPVFEPGEWTQLAVQRIDTPGLIGDLGVRLEVSEPTAELGFTIARHHWGNGFGREALRAIAAFLLDDIELERVVAFTHHENIASIASLHAAGLMPVAVDGDELLYYRSRTGSKPFVPRS